MNQSRKFSRVGIGTALAAATLTACANISPATSIRHAADPNAGATKEIVASFPGAHNIEVIEASGNPNYIQWTLPNGQRCTALASAVHFRSQTPGSLIDQPYCR